MTVYRLLDLSLLNQMKKKKKRGSAEISIPPVFYAEGMRIDEGEVLFPWDGTYVFAVLFPTVIRQVRQWMHEVMHMTTSKQAYD